MTPLIIQRGRPESVCVKYHLLKVIYLYYLQLERWMREQSELTICGWACGHNFQWSTVCNDPAGLFFLGFFSELHKTEGDDTFGPRLWQFHPSFSWLFSCLGLRILIWKRDEERQGRRHTTGLWKTVLANGVLPLGEFLLGSGYAPRVCYAWQDEKETHVHLVSTLHRVGPAHVRYNPYLH